MAKSQTNYATNAANNLNNNASGLANQVQPTIEPYLSSSLAGAQKTQGDVFNTVFPALQTDLTTGGYDPASLNILRSGYTSFANNGGYTPQQANQFIQQATEGTTATGESLQDQARRASIATGGLGTTGALSQMARQLGQTQGQNTLNAEVALNQQENANKFSGLSGLNSTEANVSGNKLGASGQLGGLYNTATGQVETTGNQMLDALKAAYGGEASAGDILTALSKNPGKFQTLLGDIAGLGGAAAGAAGALGVAV